MGYQRRSVGMAAVVVMMVAVLLTQGGEAQLTCGTVVTTLTPCIQYLRTGAGGVPPSCCSGVKSLKSVASTPASRKIACQCIKTAASNIPNIKFPLAASLPGKCGVNIPYKISPTTDCSKVN